MYSGSAKAHKAHPHETQPILLAIQFGFILLLSYSISTFDHRNLQRRREGLREVVG